MTKGGVVDEDEEVETGSLFGGGDNDSEKLDISDKEDMVKDRQCKRSKVVEDSEDEDAEMQLACALSLSELRGDEGGFFLPAIVQSGHGEFVESAQPRRDDVERKFKWSTMSDEGISEMKETGCPLGTVSLTVMPELAEQPTSDLPLCVHEPGACIQCDVQSSVDITLAAQSNEPFESFLVNGEVPAVSERTVGEDTSSWEDASVGGEQGDNGAQRDAWEGIGQEQTEQLEVQDTKTSPVADKLKPYIADAALRRRSIVQPTDAFEAAANTAASLTTWSGWAVRKAIRQYMASQTSSSALSTTAAEPTRESALPP
jgi:hypothetical protein